MATKVENLKDHDGKMTFTISNVDVSYVNALRRIILSEIPTIVFKTNPHEQNKSKIMVNTSRLHNEIIKQRLSCIPICISAFSDENYKNYLLDIDVENNTDTNMIVTTEDFKILDKTTNTYLDHSKVKKIFPPFIPPTGNGEYYIDFLRLRPKLSDELPGERIKLTCEFSKGTAKEDTAFNVVGTCSYGYTPDYSKMEEQLEIRKQKWKDQGKKDNEIKYEAANWKLLEGMRYVIKNSFDFILETVGIYDNDKLLIESCKILINKFEDLQSLIDKDELIIKPSENTLENSYDVILENEDYTIGNILNYELYKTFYNELKLINYVGFKKIHPHDTESILRVSITDSQKGISSLKTILKSVIEEANKNLINIKGRFDGSR